jgi:predicted tellurium resistance membrane protein TerC
VIFISIIAEKLPENQRRKLRLWGIGLAMVMRLALLSLISWIMHLEINLFTVLENEISGKDLVLMAGGLFLLYKSTREIYLKTEADEAGALNKKKGGTFGKLLIEVLLLDLVFSIDSIITAVGMANELWVMYTAVVVTVIIMLAAAKPISEFILKHPSFKILALCFLMLIGVSLLAEGLDIKIPKGYIYFAMAFSFLVDVIQMKTVKKK